MDSLIYPVILETDFLYKHHLFLDFTSSPVTIQHNTSDLDSVQPLWDATVEAKAKRCATAAINAASDHDIVEECSIPHYDKPLTYRAVISILVRCSKNTRTCLDQYQVPPPWLTIIYQLQKTQYEYPHEEFLAITSKRLNKKSVRCYNKAS